MHGTISIKDIHVSGGIWNRNSNKQVALDPRLRARGQRDRQVHFITT